MKQAEKIEQHIREWMEAYGLSYHEFFADFEDNDELIEEYPAHDHELSVEFLEQAGKVLGVNQNELLALDDRAAGRWYKKYPYFFHQTGFEDAYKKTFYGERYDAVRLQEVLFKTNLEDRYPLRFDCHDIKKRLISMLNEYDKIIPGTYHKSGKIIHLQVNTGNFCYYDGVEEMVNSFIEMVERAKTLFFRAWDAELSEDEINEYNFLVSSVGITDYALGSSHYLYYDHVRRCKDLFKDEGYKDFYSYAKFSRKKCFYPWRCAEFVSNRELVQAFVNIYPHTKAEMRDFAMKASNFECIIIWSDAKPIQLLSDEEASVDSIQRKLDILHMGLPRYDGQIKEPTIIYVPKTTEEFGDGEKYAKMLIELSSPSKLGGLHLPEREIPEYAMQSANAMQRMQMRIGLRGGRLDV